MGFGAFEIPATEDLLPALSNLSLLAMNDVEYDSDPVAQDKDRQTSIKNGQHDHNNNNNNNEYDHGG